MSETGNHVTPSPAQAARDKPQFPEGLRVLAVDDNVVCLKLLAALLMKCRFIVTVTTKATEALEMLRKKKDSFDIVIIDVVMPDMDGFKLLEIIGLEMDIPVIMMSASDDRETVMKGIEHGARDYLTKPVRLNEIKNIWQHVLRKNLPYDSMKLGDTIKERKEDQDLVPSKSKKQKGKEKEVETYAQFDEEETYSNKAPRLNWNKELHNKFLEAVHQIGFDNATPKKILKKMNDPRLSQEKVSNYLNRYRITLRKNAEMNKESKECNTDLSIASMHLPNPTATSSGIPPSDTQDQTFGAFLDNNGRPQLSNQNQQQICLPQNQVPQQVADQTVPIPASTFAQNSPSQTESDWTRFHSTRANVANGQLSDGASQFPSLNTGQFGPTTMPNVPHSYPLPESIQQSSSHPTFFKFL